MPVLPKTLCPGATIGICAPAGPVHPAALRRGCDMLRSWGFRVVLAPHAERARGYLAGSDQARADDLNRFFRDPGIHGILAARGGYGSMRILPLLDWALIRNNPKWFGGFSDITALHMALTRETGLVTFHSPMAEIHGDGSMPEFNQYWLQRALTSPEPLGEIASPPGGPPVAPLVGGQVTAPLTGGNLSLLVGLLGTPWEPDTDDRILLLEDVDEAPYRVDRMLTQLLLAGKLDRVAGIVFGHSPTCERAPEGRRSLRLDQVLEDLLVPLGVPLIYGFPSGHSRYRASLPLGVMATLDADAGTLTILEPATFQ